MSKPMVTSACIRCGTKFQQPLWRSKHKTAVKKTCSPQCCYNGRRGTLEERFFDKVKKTASCWLWTASTRDGGYGGFWYKGKLELAHRFSFYLRNGNWPKLLMHTCDTRLCVNPAHLKAATLSQNSQDMMKKNRSKNAKLKVEQVLAIAQELKGKPFTWDTYLPIAKKFGVRESTIYGIHIGRTWTYITMFPKLKLGGVKDFETVSCSTPKADQKDG